MAEVKAHKHKMFLYVGGIIIILGLVADFIGMGSHPGIGAKQWTVVLLGAVILLLGIKPCQSGKSSSCCSKN